MKNIDFDSIKKILLCCLIVAVIIIFIALSFDAIIFLVGVALIIWLIWFIKRKIMEKKYKKDKVVIIDMEDK